MKTARKTKRAAKPKEITEETFEVLHAACLARRNDVDWDDILSELAATFGVPIVEARQWAAREGWELERNADLSTRWMLRVGGGATTEEEFCKHFMDNTYGHLVAHGPEGVRLARAIARSGWARYQADVRIWQAVDEERAASEAHREWEEIERDREALRNFERRTGRAA